MQGNELTPYSNGQQPSPYFLLFESPAAPWKSIAKVLRANFLQATLMINQFGIYIQENTENGGTMFEASMQGQLFKMWHIPTFENPESVICLGFDTKDFCEQLESVTKTNNLKIYVLASDVKTLQMDILGKDGTSHKFISLVNTKPGNLIASDYKEHMPTARVPGLRFSKVGTAAEKQSKLKVRITAQDKGIVVSSTSSTVRGFREDLGDWVDGKQILFDDVFSTARFKSFGWMGKTDVSRFIRIYAVPGGLPLRLSANVGDLGTCSLYLNPEAVPVAQVQPPNAFAQLTY